MFFTYFWDSWIYFKLINLDSTNPFEATTNINQIANNL